MLMRHYVHHVNGNLGHVCIRLDIDVFDWSRSESDGFGGDGACSSGVGVNVFHSLDYIATSCYDGDIPECGAPKRYASRRY